MGALGLVMTEGSNLLHKQIDILTERDGRSNHTEMGIVPTGELPKHRGTNSDAK